MNITTIDRAMTRSIPLVDRFSITLSVLCIVHCLLLPVLFVMLPSLAASILGAEAVHESLVYMVIPSSLISLGLGCRQHSRSSFILVGIIGLSFLVCGIATEQWALNEIWEKLFTMFGAILIVFAHVRNYQLCRASTDCSCDN